MGPIFDKTTSNTTGIASMNWMDGQWTCCDGMKSMLDGNAALNAAETMLESMEMDRIEPGWDWHMALGKTLEWHNIQLHYINSTCFHVRRYHSRRHRTYQTSSTTNATNLTNANAAGGKPQEAKAKAAKKAALKGTNSRTLRKVRTSVTFHRPKSESIWELRVSEASERAWRSEAVGCSRGEEA